MEAFMGIAVDYKKEIINLTKGLSDENLKK